MITLGILVIIIEIPLAKKESNKVWKAMSTNQRDFFKNDIKTLTKKRGLTAMYVGIFTIVIGTLFIGVSMGLFLLDRDLQQKMIMKPSSRLPYIEKSEQVVFKGMSEIIDAERDAHHKKL